VRTFNFFTGDDKKAHIYFAIGKKKITI